MSVEIWPVLRQIKSNKGDADMKKYFISFCLVCLILFCAGLLNATDKENNCADKSTYPADDAKTVKKEFNKTKNETKDSIKHDIKEFKEQFPEDVKDLKKDLIKKSDEIKKSASEELKEIREGLNQPIRPTKNDDNSK